jgi:hypothetical protein
MPKAEAIDLKPTRPSRYHKAMQILLGITDEEQDSMYQRDLVQFK